MLRITKEFIKTYNFESVGLTFPQDNTQISYRPRKGVNLPPSVDENMTALKKKFVDIFFKKYEGNYVKLEVHCQIKESSMRKYLKGTRTITRDAIAKFCIGTKLTLEESAELFTLHGHSLEPTKQRFDALVVNALQDGDDIGIFFETCKEYRVKIE